MENQEISQIIKSWEGQNTAITDIFSKYEDDYYFTEIAPGRNRAIYLLGHLIGMNDILIPMLGLGDKLFPELEPIFVTSPDKSFDALPPIAELRNKWSELNKTLTAHFSQMTKEDWLSRHTKVSAEDFALDPTRNKLNVFIGRIGHMHYHRGQLTLITPRS